MKRNYFGPLHSSRQMSDLRELKSEVESGKLKDERQKIAY